MTAPIRRPLSASPSAGLSASLAAGAALALAVSLLVLVAGTSSAGAATRWRLTDPFSREVVSRGDVDHGPYDIEHVFEVQFRLKWLGFFKGTPDGHFRAGTRDAVLAFQKANGLRETGTVNRPTWKPLIQQTIRGARLIPKGCRAAGAHACYDRRRHQLTLFRDGHLVNAWLGRGGRRSNPTRVGTFRVYYRDADHRSSEYDNAPMPYAQFFSGGEAIHGSRYMVNPFRGHSHGCVNLYVEDAHQLWKLTASRPLTVHVYGRWS
ncbi:MAG: L,D-transpeptidase family protein [Nocardioidaceae bacterium]